MWLPCHAATRRLRKLPSHAIMSASAVVAATARPGIMHDTASHWGSPWAGEHMQLVRAWAGPRVRQVFNCEVARCTGALCKEDEQVL